MEGKCKHCQWSGWRAILVEEKCTLYADILPCICGASYTRTEAAKSLTIQMTQVFHPDAIIRIPATKQPTHRKRKG
jgi:hypothetical protein